nr:MAG TPA: minor tail protein [Caudoviricetes sp.]
MPNVGAEFTASIVIDKNDLIAQALKQLSTAQKELEKNKLEIYFDLSNTDLSKKLKEYQKQLSSTDYTIKINNNGIEETYKSLDKLLDIVKTIASGKDFGTGFGNINADNAVKQIDKLENRISELNKKYDELQKKSVTGGISGKEVNLVDNDEFKKLSQEVSELKGQFDDLKTHMSLLDDYTVPTDRFFELQTQVEATSVKVSDLVDEMTRLSNIQKNIGAETNISSGMKDAFPDKDVSASVEKIADGFKEVKQETEEATESAKDYVRTISQVGEWNVDSKVSVVKERNDGQLETWNYDAKRGKKDITYDKDGNINYGDPIITTISNYKQLEQTIVKADDKLRDLRKALEDIKEINPNASTKNIEKQIQYQKEYISLLEQTVKIISQGDEYFLNEQQIIDARKKATTEYDLKQGTKSDISNAKQSAKANEQAIRQEQKLTDELRKQEEQARKTALSYTESASKKLSNAISKYSYGDSSDATAMMKQMNRGLSNFGDLSNIESNIKNFDSVVDSIITDLKRSHEDALSSLNSEIKAEETMQKQKDAFNKSNLNAIDMEIKKREEEAKAFSNSLKAQMESQQQAESQMSKFGNTLSKYQTKTSGYDATIARFNDGGWTSDTYLKNVQAVRDAVQQYATLLDNIKTNQNGIATDEDIQNLDEYEKKIKDTIATVTNMSASEKGYSRLAGQKEIDKINKILRENSAMSSEAKAKIKAYKQELISGNPSVSLEKIHGEILKIVNAEELAGRAGRSFFDTLKNSGFHQLAAQMAGMFGFYDVINLGKKGFNVVRELNTALTEMRKVSNETVQSLKNYQATTFDTADAVGTTAKQIQNSTADWMRLGESMDQAAESAKDANVLFNVSEFEGIDEATESLVSMSQAYKDLDKMDIIDVLNNIGNNYSISTDGLATALKDSASALVTANNDLNEAVSLTTAGNAITQDPSKVGAGLRTISLRLVGTEEAKEELSDLGEETDGMITTVSKLRDTIMDATKAASSDGKGFDILDSNGNYKSTYEIMQGLADLYDDIVKKDKELGTNNLNLLLETIAGKNRSNIAASILQNGDMLRSVYEDAQNSEGSAEKELNSYLDSIDGKMAQLENRAQEFWFKVIDSETIKNGIDLLSTLLKGATDFVDTVGLLPTILTGVAAAFSFKNVGIDTLVAY